MKVIKKPFVLTHKFEDVEVDIRAMTPGEQHDIADKCLHRRFVRDDAGNPETVVEFDFRTERIDRAKLSVVDWRGFTDEDGSEITCSKENVEVLMEYVDGFAAWLLSRIADTLEAKSKHDADLQKN